MTDGTSSIDVPIRRYHDKEVFVTGHEGSTTPFEIFLLCLVVPVGLYLHQTIVIATSRSLRCSGPYPQQQQQRIRDVGLEFITLIMPMLLVQTSLLPYIVGPCLLLLGMVVVAVVICHNTTRSSIRSIEEDAAINNESKVTVVGQVKMQEEEEEDISSMPRDVFGRITPVKKKMNNEDLATTNGDATPEKQKARVKTSKTTTVVDTTITTTPTLDVFGRIKYNISNELSSSKEDVTRINNNKEVDESAPTVAQLPHNNRPIYLSAHRAYVYLLTTIAILAVDFPLFPRRYCKTEIVGYGFMDLGAASFVIVAGWTSSVMQQQFHHQYSQQSNSSTSNNNSRGTSNCYHYYKVIKKCTPLLLIGIIRLATTKGLEYQEHVSEYGIHWNFFFTLCCIELIMILWKQIKTTLFWSLTTASPYGTKSTYISVDLVLGVALMVSYQLYLSQYGGQEFIVYANRQCFANTYSSLCNAFAANREGILGVIGYCSLRLLSECIAKVCLLPPPPSSSNDISSQQRRLIYMSLGLWVLHSLVSVGLHIPNSRRSTNASFILWALAHNTSLLTCIHAVMATNINNNDRRLDIFLPWILSSVNDFGLEVFLSSNVLTGLVNLSVDTLHSSNNKAMLILSVYLVLVCGFALFLDTFKRRREKID